MRCPACTAENRPDAPTCAACQAPLTRCGSCEGAILPGARFCHHCGAATAARPPQEAEKRLVTVLFADMSSSVEAMRDLHPEDAVSLVNVPLELMVDAVLDHGGKVDRFLGDGLLAVWGTPRAREDDPQQAIRAALAMRDGARKHGLDVAAGINTGDAYVGRVGSPRYQEVTVMGSSVNMAARLEDEANPGEVLVGEGTYRLTRRAFDFSPRLVEVRGLARPLAAYRVESQVRRPEKARGLEGGPVPLVGREPELAALREALEEVVQGQGRLIGITGEAGIGKSRLVAEARAERDLASRRILWLEGRCLEATTSAGLAPFADLLQQYFQWQPDEDEVTRRRRIGTAMADLHVQGALTDIRAREIGLLVGHLLSVSMEGDAAERLGALDSPQFRTRTLKAVRDFLFALARLRPVVLVLEDLHWSDSLSLLLLEHLAGGIAARSLLVLGSFRPESGYPNDQRLTELFSRTPAALEVPLQVFSTEQSGRLFDNLAGPATIVGELRRTIIDRARGNPFFLEELVRSVVETGAHPRAEVPETLQTVILTRVDRLAPELRRFLQHASVIGKVFPTALLPLLGHSSAEVRNALLDLEDDGLIYLERATPVEEFSFKHVLTQETVYDSILPSARRRLHRQLAEGLEQLYGDAAIQVSEALAEHYVRAEQYAPAIEHLLRSGEKAARLYANQEALGYFQRTSEALDRLPAASVDPQVRLRTLECLGDMLFRLGRHPEAEQQFRAALNAAREISEPRTLARLHHKVSDAVHWQGHWSQAIAIAGEGLAALGPDRLNPEGISLLEVSMRSCWATSDMEGARRWGDEITALLPRVPYYDNLYMVYYALAWLEIKSGNLEAAEEWLQTVERLCQEHQNENGLARAYHGLGDLNRARRDYQAAADWFLNSLDFCERTGDTHLLMEGHIEYAHMLVVLRGDPGDIAFHIGQGLRIAGEMSRTGGVSSIQGLCGALGDGYAEVGELETALAYYRKAFEFGRHPAPDRTLGRMQELYARVGRPEEFEAFQAGLVN